MFQKKIIAAALSLAAFSCAAGAAPLATAAYAAPADAGAQSTLTIGGGMAIAPEYMGSDKMRALPVIAIDYQRSDGFFASTTRGLGYVTKLAGFTVTGALGYDAGRSDTKDGMRTGSDYLRGMGKIKGAAIANLTLAYDLGPVQLEASTAQALSHRERGNTYQLGATMPVLKTARDQVTVAASVKLGDSKHTQTFYGVSAEQSRNSRFSQYQAGSGVENVAVGVNWNRVLNKEWSLQSTAGVAQLVGDAADSPIVRRKTAPMLMVTASYKFF